MDRFRLEGLDADTDVALLEMDRSDANTVAEHCKALHNAGLTGDGDMKLAMSVPGWFIVDWCNKKGITIARFMREQSVQTRFLEDPELSMFRVWKGRI